MSTPRVPAGVPAEKPHRISVRGPVEEKVKGAIGGTLAGTPVSALVVWLLGVFVWGGPWDAANAAYTLSLVPTVVTLVVIPLVSATGTFLGGYWARHTARPDVAPAQVVGGDPTA